MFALYSGYLGEHQVTVGDYSCAPITEDAANKSVWVVQRMGYDSYAVQNSNELSLTVYINEKAVSRVIEGCNAVSIIILFIAFIIAFSSSFLATFSYAFIGSVIIYAVNILRIAIIGVALYKFPEQQQFFHQLLFPAIIYGLVLVLWVIWVQKFSKVKRE